MKLSRYDKRSVLTTAARLLLEQVELAVEENLDDRRERYDYVHTYAEASLLAYKQREQAYKTFFRKPRSRVRISWAQQQSDLR